MTQKMRVINGQPANLNFCRSGNDNPDLFILW